MKRLAALLVICFGCASAWLSVVQAQGRGPTDWMTSNADAQRSSWVRTDAKISSETLQKPGFKFLWKLIALCRWTRPAGMIAGVGQVINLSYPSLGAPAGRSHATATRYKLKNEPKQLNSLTPLSLLERLIGYRGFRMLGFVGGSSDNVFALDTDLGRMEWEKHFDSSAPSQAGTLTCPGGMTTGVTRPTIAALPPLALGGGGGGRSNPARSAVGEPGKGAVTLALVRPNPPATAAPPPSSAPHAPVRPNPANPPGGQFGSGPFLVYALSSDGKLHSLHLSNGADYEPPVQFLPPNTNANRLIVIDNIAYVVTEGGCGGAANGVWALDLATKQATTWKANVSVSRPGVWR